MKNLSELRGGMPVMKAAFQGWTQKLTFVVITQLVTAGGLMQDTERTITFPGTVQPLKPAELMMKPEGERSWEWLQVHVPAPAIALNTSDRIIFAGRRYKVMAKNDYSINGFVIYHIVQDFQNE